MVLWLVLIFVLSLVPVSSTSAPRIPHLDKIVHFGFYFVFTALLFWVLTYECKLLKNKIWVYLTSFIIPFSVGICIEYLQETMTKARSGDYFDILANTFGIVVALLFMTIFRKASRSIRS
ncbi:MAG: VanZ family protein [Capnocytophaga sp.]|nr:VanZ family protein [Capnocytophaga sp.]